MDLHEKTEYKGYNINIYHDECSESPRDWDNLGTFYTAHRRYCPEKEFDQHFEFDEVCEGKPGNFKESFLKKYIALNIYLYDHSGQTVSATPFSCPWDSGWFGMVAVSLEKVKQEFGWKRMTTERRKKIESYLEGEIEAYDQYLRGEVYGFTITPKGNDSDTKDSCWGYWGDSGITDIKKECYNFIDNQLVA